MSLNIKNEHTHRLVRELAEASGSSQTAAVEDAVARRLAEVRAVAGERDARIDLALSRIRAALSEEDREALRHDAAELYDEAGLPR